jgi:hypothetical protein
LRARLSRTSLGDALVARVGIGSAILLVAVALSWPMLTTTSGLAQDWPNHLWYMWRQSLDIRADGVPSLFLNADHGVFYPFYGFYGGTLYSLAGTLSLLLGNAPVKAYLLTWILGLSGAYGGFFWLARMAGVTRWLSHVPALVYVTSAYTLTLIYARGAWPEFMATSAIPLFVASSLHILRNGRLTALPALALAVSTVVLTGSHNITLLWGGTFTVLLCVAAVAFIPAGRRLFVPRKLSRWLLVAAPSVLVNSWFLLPAVAYSSRTRIGSANWSLALQITSVLTGPARLLTLSRGTSVTASPGIAYAPDFSLALPVLAIGWVLLGAGLLAARRRWYSDPFARLLMICLGLGLLFVVLLTNWHLINDLPGPYHLVQFPYRLETYVLFATCGALIALLAIDRTKIYAWLGWRVLLGAVVVASVVGAAIQVAAYPSQYADRNSVFDAAQQPPLSVYDTGDYDDATLPVLSIPAMPTIAFPEAQIHDARARVTFAMSPQQTLVQSNIRGAPYLVRVVGARVAGRTPEGFMVLQLPADHPQMVSVAVEQAASAPIVIGRVLSLAGAALLAALLCVAAFRSARHGVRTEPVCASSASRGPV